MKYILSVALLIVALSAMAMEVYTFGPDVDYIYFASMEQNHMALGAINNSDHHLYLYNETDWDEYTYFAQGLPITGTCNLNETTLMVAMGNGSYSDGVYNFDLNTHQWTINEWFMLPNFLRYCPENQKYYVGERDGLYHSADGINWSRIMAVGTNKCDSFASFENHLISNNGSLVYYSNNSGQSWQQANTSDLREFRYSGSGTRIYAIMDVGSNSDGLWYSDDFGATWSVAMFTAHLSAIGPDFYGEFPLGWSQANENGNYLELWVNGQLYSLSVAGLNSPVKQLDTFPYVNTPAFYVLNDEGFFWCANFLVMDNDDELSPELQSLNVKVYPNPARAALHLEFVDKEDQIDLELYDLKGRQVLAKSGLKVQDGGLEQQLPPLPSAVYLLQIKAGKKISRQRVILY